MKIGVGQIIFMRSGAHQRMNYYWRIDPLSSFFQRVAESGCSYTFAS